MKPIKYFLAGLLLALSASVPSAVFNVFKPATGILVGNANTFVTTAATAANLNPILAATAPTITGNWTFSPSSGIAQTIIPASGQNALNVPAPTGQAAALLLMGNGNTAGAGLSINQNASGVGVIAQLGAAQLALQTNSVTRIQITGAGAVAMPSIAASSAATTGTVCWTTITGNLTVDTTTTCLASTIKVKQKINSLDSGLAEVMQLHPVSYELKPEFNPAHLGRQTGLIAEEVIKIDPRLVALDDNGNPRSVRYQQLTAVLIKAIQEQQHEIEVLKKRLH